MTDWHCKECGQTGRDHLVTYAEHQAQKHGAKSMTEARCDVCGRTVTIEPGKIGFACCVQPDRSITEDQLKAIESMREEDAGLRYPADDVLALIAEVRRLRTLVGEAEWDSYAWDAEGDSEACCPWCRAEMNHPGIHAETCPAFLPDGTVR